MPVSDKLVIKQLDLELNGGCNYKCPMCPQSNGREREFLKKLPYEVFTKIIDDACQYGLEGVSIHGSGEPLLNRDADKFIKYIKSKSLRCVSFTNGSRLDEEMSIKLIKSGIDLIRISCVGYDRETYKKWMSRDEYEKVRKNIKRFIELNKELKGNTEVQLYNLIIDNKSVKKEIEMYKSNWIEYTGAKSEIWLMHNWAGSNVELNYNRHKIPNKKLEKRSCGRPFAPMLQVRAGGLDGHYGAVVACCVTLGKDSQAVLGHLDNQTIEEIVKGKKYEELRLAHKENRFDDIDYCKDCDMLYDIPESLVWTNCENRNYGQSIIVEEIFHSTYT